MALMPASYDRGFFFFLGRFVLSRHRVLAVEFAMYDVGLRVPLFSSYLIDFIHKAGTPLERIANIIYIIPPLKRSFHILDEVLIGNPVEYSGSLGYYRFLVVAAQPFISVRIVRGFPAVLTASPFHAHQVSSTDTVAQTCSCSRQAVSLSNGLDDGDVNLFQRSTQLASTE